MPKFAWDIFTLKKFTVYLKFKFDWASAILSRNAIFVPVIVSFFLS